MAKILVLYHSQQYGNTGAMAEAVAKGAREGGAEVTLANTNTERLDPEAYRAFDAAAFGSPDYYSTIAGGLKVFLDDWHIAKLANGFARMELPYREGLTDKPYAVFDSHGGGGKVRGPLEEYFTRMGTKVGETVESRGHPDDATLADCTQLGRQLAEAAGGGS